MDVPIIYSPIYWFTSTKPFIYNRFSHDCWKSPWYHHSITIKITTKYIIIPLYILIPNIFLIHIFHTGIFPWVSHPPCPVQVPQVPRTAFATRRKARSRGSLIALSSSAVAWDGWPWLVRLGKMVKVVMFVGKSREKDGFYGTFHGKIHGKWWRDGNCMRRSMENDAFWCWFCGDVLELISCGNIHGNILKYHEDFNHQIVGPLGSKCREFNIKDGELGFMECNKYNIYRKPMNVPEASKIR